MKLRKLKKIIQAQQWFRTEDYWQKVIDNLMEPTPEEQARQKAMQAEFFKEIMAMLKPSPPAVKWYQVAKKSTGEVVSTHSTRESAEEAVDKAKRNKKAALVLVA